MESSDPVSTGTRNQPDGPARSPGVAPAPDAAQVLAGLQGFCETLGTAFWVYDLDAARIDFVSSAYEELWGRPTSELYEDGDAWLGAVHEEDLERVKSALHQLEQGHYDVTYRIRRPNGDLRWVRTRAVSFLTDGSGGRRVAGMAEDVTSAQKADESLRRMAADLSAESSAHYFQTLVRSLAEASEADHVFVGTLDPDDPGLVRTIALCSKGNLVEGFHYHLAHTPCESVFDNRLCFYPQQVQCLFPKDEDLAKMGVEGYMGTPLQASDGRVLGILVALYERPITDEVHVRTLFRVSAERAGAELVRRLAERSMSLANERLEERISNRTQALKEANQSLQASQERVRMFVQSSGDAIWCLEPSEPIDASAPVADQMRCLLQDCRVVECNDAAARILGFKHRDHLRGSTLSEMASFSCPAGSALLQRLIRRGYRLADEEQTLVTEDGVKHHLRGNFTGVLEEGFLRSLWCVQRDISEQVESQESERLRTAQLEQISRLNTAGELAAGIAHELNQPLSAIVNYVGGCLRRLEGADEELIEALKNAGSQAERAGEILRRLRRYSRRGEHQPVVCSLNEIVQSAVRLLVPRTRELGITVQLELCTEEDLVLADSEQVVQVLANLVRNGHEAMDSLSDEERLLVVRTRGEGTGFMLVEVEDRGPGLPLGDEERVFEPFYTTRDEAIGLGLTISRSIVEDHGGRLWATPKGTGCAFCFTLPRASSKIPS